MKRRFLPLLLALLLITGAAAQCPLEMSAPLQGEYVWPEGSDAADALYVYRCTYPQIAGESEVAMHINNTYLYQMEDALGFEVPMLASGMQEGDMPKQVEISYETTCASERYLSFSISKEVRVGDDVTQVIAGHVFALTGEAAGRIVSLPVFLGILKAEETDDWLINRQTSKADKLVRELVWDEIVSADETALYYDDLTFEELEASFYPEEDFYLSPEGDPCFYFQPGAIAPEEMGVITFVIPLWVLQDEL